ncbi:CARDB domain-containing protein [Clostridiaceae bacterium 35-E11]
MKRKWTYLFILCMIMSLMYPPALALEAGGPVKLSISRHIAMPEFKAGEEVRWVIPIENSGGEAAKDVLVTPAIGDLKDFPFEMDRIVMQRKISSIGTNSKEDAVFYPKVSLNAEAKIYAIPVNIEYTTPNGGGGSQTETVYLKIVNDHKQPSLKVNKVILPGDKLPSGKSSTIKLDIKNDSDLMVKDIAFQLSGFTSDGITLDGTQDIQNVRSLEGKHYYQVPFNVYVDEDLESGTYSLDLTIKYKDQYDKAYQQETKIYLPVEGLGSQETDFVFEHVVYPKEGVSPNEDFDISFDLKNTGQEEARNVKISVDAGSEILPKTLSMKNIGTLAAGKSIPLAFKFFAKEGIESKNYPIKLNVEYDVKGGGSKTVQTANQYVGVFVKEGTGQNTSPKVIVNDYSYDGEYVKAGAPFSLTISFFNTNSKKAVQNVKVSLKSEGDVFSPVDSSNSFFIGSIQPNGKVQKSIQLKPKVDANYQTHNIVAEIEYEDNKGEKYTASEMMGIPVIQEIKLMTTEVEIPTENFIGNPVGITLDFYNIGRAMIRNMMIRTEGDFDIQDGNLYIGNLEAGKDNYYDVTITPNKEGTLTGKIIFEYDDDIGNHYVTEKEFAMNVIKQEEPMMPEEGMKMEQPPQASSKKGIFIFVGMVIVGVVGFIIYKKRFKKKEEVATDE